jgi:diguanylate cyclase (GGDEF)-like protein
MTALAERVHELRVRYRNEELTAFTFSAGVAAFPAHGATAGELMLAADRALYAAKDAGRNCTLSAEAPR